MLATIQMIGMYIHATVFTILGILHVYWACGGRWLIRHTIPTDRNGEQVFTPGRLGTSVVALGLFGFAVVNLIWMDVIHTQIDTTILRMLMTGIAILFFIRAFGDFKYVGWTRRFEASAFAKRDRTVYTPLCALLSLGHVLLIMVMP
jgi:hypothetical protein